MIRSLVALVTTLSVCLVTLAAPPRQSAVTVLHGDVATPLQVTVEMLDKMPQTTVKFRGKDGADTLYRGVALADVLKAGGVAAGDHPGKAVATYVAVAAADGYEVVFGLGELTPAISGRTIILADRANGMPLAAAVGPFRVIVDGDKIPARCIRNVTEIRVVKLRK